EDIAMQMDSIGASIASQSGNNTLGLSMTLARGERDLEFAAELLGDILANATYPEDQFAKQLEVLSMMAVRQNANWVVEVQNFMRRELFGGNPYANSPYSTPEVVAKLTRDDVLEFAAAKVRPEGMVIAVAGDVDVAKTIELLKAALEGWTPEGEYVLTAPAAPAWEGGGLPEPRFAFRENEKAQASLCIAFPGTRYTNLEDRAALTLVDAFTSGIGMPSGWLHTALRGGDRSYVYYVHLTNFTGLEPGCLYITTQTETRYLKEVYDLLMAEIDRLRRGEFTEEELELGRAMALVAQPYSSQTVNAVATGLALSELYGVGYDGDEKFEALVKKVTREDVMRVVKKHFGHMVVAVAGPAGAREAFESLK
ncbi:MAG: pitrilysin family protein, partial [Planctomycetota bacterium]